MPNNLIYEKSPYLLQHSNNPVDWYPWCDEAFELARQLDIPIFLSIGYSTCHWCHVMEIESFEDEVIAEMMNKAFVNIKLDREERPDIDSIYMEVCQILTGSGGWPLTIIMTPEQKPFFAGTYFPKYSQFGRIGMYELITKIDELWKTRREDILQSAESITTRLLISEKSDDFDISPEQIFREAYKQLSSSFDYRYGGFRNAPKFPTPHNLQFLLRYWKIMNEKNALEMVEKTLTAMRYGGIYDHIGFGFHRYSTDNKWIVPHFEKMLYDQSLLITSYTEAYLATKNELFKKTALETTSYILRELTSEEGGFYSAEDADSEGIEGKYYLWSDDEIKQVLKEDADTFRRYFSVLDKGNFHFEHQFDNNANILFMQFSHSEHSKALGINEETLNSIINRCINTLLQARNNRIKPYKDDKVLTDWNGLAISALALAGFTFDKPKLI